MTHCAAETLIPIIRQSVPAPFPADMEKSKQEGLTQCTQQAIEAIEALQEAIGEVSTSRLASKYIAGPSTPVFVFLPRKTRTDVLEPAKTLPRVIAGSNTPTHVGL